MTFNITWRLIQITFIVFSGGGCLIRESAAADCFPQATWPKLIGYGKADTEVEDMDRRDSDGMLALLIASGEEDFIKNAGTSDTTVSFAAFDTETETYKWWKVFSNARPNLKRYVYFTPDGSKVLAYFFTSDRNMVYLNADTGA